MPQIIADKDVLGRMEKDAGPLNLVRDWLHPLKLRCERLYLQAPTRACRVNLSHTHRMVTHILSVLTSVKEKTEYSSYSWCENLDHPELSLSKRKEIQRRLEVERKRRGRGRVIVKSQQVDKYARSCESDC